MDSPDQIIQRAFTAFRDGELGQAKTLLCPLKGPEAFHLLGLVERGLGQPNKARKALNRARRMDPDNPEIHVNSGNIEFDEGSFLLSEKYYRTALAIQPDFLPALKGLARCFEAQKNWTLSYDIQKKILRLAPTDTGAKYGIARARHELGQIQEARKIYDGLLKDGNNDPAIWFMRGRAGLELNDADRGITGFRKAWRLKPTRLYLSSLANALWMNGDTDGFYELIRTAPTALSIDAINLLRQADASSAAIDMWTALPDDVRCTADAFILRARIARDLNDASTTQQMAEAALALQPTDVDVIDTAIYGRLMNGDPEGAVKLILPQKKAYPFNQHWIAHHLVALRMLGDPYYHDLIDYDRHVRVYELPLPDGHATIEDFNAALDDAIAPLRHFARHPLDQSLKQGTQTSRDITSLTEPVMGEYLKTLKGPIRDYIANFGGTKGHPFNRMNTGSFRISGCWSVALQSGGRHVNHVHPRGWISSAYYLKVTRGPQNTGHPSTVSRAGWIKFGEPPYKTKPALEPEKWIEPKPGMLVMFPSWLWHGTEPIPDGAIRITAPFDVVPA